jgi:hypothetical protein
VINPRSEAVLIHNRRTNQFDDKTRNVSRYEFQPANQRIGILFNNRNQVFAYGPDRVRILRGPTPHELAADDRVEVDGSIWESATELLTFLGVDGAWSRVGELDGGTITARVREIAAALPYAEPTDNVLGNLWGKEAYGAMLWPGAVSDLPIADSLAGALYRALMIAVAAEVLAQAPVPVESFDGFVPADLAGSLDRLAEFNRRSVKTHSGIYRDLMVRKRKTEVDEVHKDIQGPLFDRVVDMIHDIEQGRRTCEVANLDELAGFAAGLSFA